MLNSWLGLKWNISLSRPCVSLPTVDPTSSSFSILEQYHSIVLPYVLVPLSYGSNCPIVQLFYCISIIRLAKSLKHCNGRSIDTTTTAICPSTIFNRGRNRSLISIASTELLQCTDRGATSLFNWCMSLAIPTDYTHVGSWITSTSQSSESSTFSIPTTQLSPRLR